MEFGTLIHQSTAFIKNKTGNFIVKISNLKKKLLDQIISVKIQPVLKRQKIPLLIVIPASLLIILASGLLLTNQVNSSRQNIINYGASIIERFPENEAANWLARSRSNKEDWQIESLFKLKALIETVTGNRSLYYAFIVDDKSGSIKAHTNESMVGNDYIQDTKGKVLKEDEKFKAQRFLDKQTNKYIVDFSSPIYYGKGENRKRIGAFHFGLPFDEMEGALKRRRVLHPLIAIFTFLTATGFVLVKDKLDTRKKPAVLPHLDGNRIGPYILEKKIASGGMGELFLARKEIRKEIGSFSMRVAVKRILSEKANDKEYISFLFDEANLASQLRHPNIVTLHDFGDILGTYFIAMEFVEGENLLAIMNICQESIPVGQILYIISEICKGLDYAHNKNDDFSKKPLNIVHRDISPQNILVSFEGDVKIVDFGIARAAQRQSKNTTYGVVKGKLHYMSPEQASGSGVIDRRSDIFSLGIIFYELLSCHKVYRGDTIQELLRSACEADIPPIGTRRSDLPEDLNRIVMKILQHAPSQRYQTAGDLLKDIMSFSDKYTKFKCTKTELAGFMKETFTTKKDNSVQQS